MDSIANTLTTIVNAQRVSKERVAVPYSNFAEQLAKFLQEKGMVAKTRVQGDEKRKLIITLQYDGKDPVIQAVEKISKPGNRKYVRAGELPYTGSKPGFYVVSTSRGLMDQDKARAEKLGGELLCAVWRIKK